MPTPNDAPTPSTRRSKRWLHLSTWSIRTKLVGLLVLTSAIPLFALAILDVREARRATFQTQVALLEARNDRTASEIDAALAGFRASTDRLADLPQVVSFTATGDGAEPVRVVLDAWRRTAPDLVALAVVDARGEARMTSRSDRVDRRVDEAMTFRPLGAPHLLPADPESDLGATIVLASTIGSEEEPLGAVVAWVAIDAVARPVGATATDGHLAVLIEDPGAVVTGSDRRASDLDLGRGTLLASPANEARTSSLGDAWLRDGTALEGVSRRLTHAPWKSVALVPRSTIEAPVAAVAVERGLFGVAVVVLALGVGVLVAGAIVRPIQALASATERFATDNTARATVRTDDELGQLARRFNEMAERTETQANALRDANEALGRAADEQARVHETTVAALDEAEARIRHLGESGLIGIIRATNDGTVVDANDTFLRMMGFDRDEIAAGAVNLQARTPPEFEVAQQRARETFASTGIRTVWEKEYFRKDGTRIPVLVGAVRADADHAHAFILDLTAQKEAEEAVDKLRVEREVDALFRSLLESAPDAMVIVDQSGGIVLLNAQAETMFGYAREELIGRPVDLLVPSERRDQHPKHREGFLSRPRTRSLGSDYSLFAQRKDGSQFPVEISLSPLATEEGILVSSAIRDITERRRVEHELRAAKDSAIASSKELEAFSYSVAHDLRAPLRAVNGYAKAVEEDAADSLPPEAGHYLKSIAAAAVRMGKLIDALLALSRVSRAEVVRTRLDVVTKVRTTFAQLQDAEPERKVELVIEPDLFVYGDSQLLRVALENLVGNAWKFTAGTKDARIEVGRVPDAKGNVIFVRDNGAGFDMRFIDKLFTPFQRLHNSAEFSGTGIGLATVQRIVARHHGRIWADGAPGAGATFYFTLDDVRGDPG